MHPDTSAEVAAAITEAAFGDWLLDMAHLFGWIAHHTRPARTARGWRTPLQGDPGFLDWVLAHRQFGVVFLELKREGGKPTGAQQVWLKVLNASGQTAFWAQPSDMDKIERLLRTGVLS